MTKSEVRMTNDAAGGRNPEPWCLCVFVVHLPALSGRQAGLDRGDSERLAIHLDAVADLAADQNLGKWRKVGYHAVVRVGVLRTEY